MELYNPVMNYELHILTAANNKDEMAHHNKIIIINFLGFKRGRKKKSSHKETWISDGFWRDPVNSSASVSLVKAPDTQKSSASLHPNKTQESDRDERRNFILQ